MDHSLEGVNEKLNRILRILEKKETVIYPPRHSWQKNSEDVFDKYMTNLYKCVNDNPRITDEFKRLIKARPPDETHAKKYSQLLKYCIEHRKYSFAYHLIEAKVIDVKYANTIFMIFRLMRPRLDLIDLLVDQEAFPYHDMRVYHHGQDYAMTQFYQYLKNYSLTADEKKSSNDAFNEYIQNYQKH